MKVSYIILPFFDPTYLVRCINSMYRQNSDNFEVILAENDFGEQRDNIEQFLGTKSQLMRIPKFKQMELNYMEKISEAFSLVSGDSDYVMLVDVNTVVTPICTTAIIKCNQSDLIIPAIAIEKDEGFVVDYPELSAIQKNFDEFMPQRLCFRRCLFDKFKPEYVENNTLFSIFLLSVLVDTVDVASTEDIVMYAQSFAVTEASEEMKFETMKEHCDTIFSKLFEIKNVEAQAIVLEKLIKRIFNLLSSDEVKTREKAFEVLKEYCKGVQQDFLLKRIIEGIVGFETDDILAINYAEYAVYKSHVKGTGNPITAIDCAEQNQLLKDIKEEVSIIKTKIATLPMPIPTAIGTVICDPCIDIPKMYQEGRLGFMTIWYSFWGWIKYKLGKKR